MQLNPDYKSPSQQVEQPITYTFEQAEKVENYKYDFPTEILELPSKGLCYPQDNILSRGFIVLKYPDTDNEDILTSQNLIQKGIVLDKFLQSIIISPINYNSLILGDKNAILVYSRILLYGSQYQAKMRCEYCKEENDLLVDLAKLEDKIVDDSVLNRDNLYEFTLPTTIGKANEITIKFKLLTVEDDKRIEQELKYRSDLAKKQGIKESDEVKKDLSTRIKNMIVAVNGDSSKAVLDKFKMSSLDSLEFRRLIKKITPDIDLTWSFECNHCSKLSSAAVPMDVSFFWPTA